MLYSGRDKERIACDEAMPRVAVHEPSAAARDDIQFVARVRMLRIDALRRVEFQRQRSMREDVRCERTRRRRQRRRLRKREMMLVRHDAR